MSLEPKEIAKTLDRGLAILDYLASDPRPKTLSEVAAGIDAHRTIALRLLRTLESRGLVFRNASKQYTLGVGLIRLAAPVQQDLRTLAQPVLRDLAESVGATANLTVPDGSDAVVLATFEPLSANAHIAYLLGQRHPLSQGAAGIAILAAGSERKDERDEVKGARRRGYAVTHAEVIPGTWGISAPVWSHGQAVGSIGVSLFGPASPNENELESAGERVRKAAQEINSRLP